MQMGIENLSWKFETPEQLNTPFRLVAGCYTAALITPGAVSFVSPHLTERSALLLLGLLGVALVSVVAVSMTRYGAVAVWLGSGNTAWLLPAIPGILVFWYLNTGIKYIIISVTSLQAQSPQAFIGFTGLILSTAATCLGVIFVSMARSQLVNQFVDESSIRVKWTAGWSRQRQVKVRIGVTIFVVSLFLLGLSWDGLPMFVTTYACVLVTVGLANIGTKRKYRAAPEGLEQIHNRWLYDSRQFVPWKEFTNYTVTDTEIIVHHQSPMRNIRCSRADLGKSENEIIKMLDEYLSKR